MLLQTGFHSPHKQLDDYIQRYTRYNVTDGEEFALKEPNLKRRAKDVIARFFSDPLDGGEVHRKDR